MKSLLERMMEDKNASEKKKAKQSKPDSPERKLMQALDDHLDKRGISKFKQKKGFSPSSTIDCARRDVYFFRGVDMIGNVDGRGQRIFDNGNSMHERYGKYFEDMGILLELEWWTETFDPPIRAYLDAVINWNGERAVMEFKSIGSDGFEWRKIGNKPKDDHVQQVQIYMEIRDIDVAYVLYENKDTQEVLIFRVERDREFINKLFTKWRKTYKMYTDGKLPKRPVRSAESKKCLYCEVREMCWNDKDSGV